MPRLLTLLLVTAALLGLAGNLNPLINTPVQTQSTQLTSEQILANAYRQRLSNIQVAGRGQVVRILRDDVQGSRHQRFILRLSSGQTLINCS